MRRRRVVWGIVGLLDWGSIANAQGPRQGIIGYVHPRTIAPDHQSLKIFRSTWQRLGYVDGETVLLRSAQGDAGRLPQLVEELISLNVGVLIVVGPEAIEAALHASKTVPISASTSRSIQFTLGMLPA